MEENMLYISTGKLGDELTKVTVDVCSIFHLAFILATFFKQEFLPLFVT